VWTHLRWEDLEIGSAGQRAAMNTYMTSRLGGKTGQRADHDETYTSTYLARNSGRCGGGSSSNTDKTPRSEREKSVEREYTCFVRSTLSRPSRRCSLPSMYWYSTVQVTRSGKGLELGKRNDNGEKELATAAALKKEYLPRRSAPDIPETRRRHGKRKE
jgi:hypothetical protein